jgi:hypothetical protein
MPDADLLVTKESNSSQNGKNYFATKAPRHKEGLNFMRVKQTYFFVFSCLRGRLLVPACPG